MPPVNSITVPTHALHRILSDTQGFTTTNEHPFLTSVHLSTSGGYLVGHATDRYVMAWSRCKTFAPAGFWATVDRDDIPSWLELLGSNDGGEANIVVGTGKWRRPVTLTVGDRTAKSTSTDPIDIDFAGILAELLAATPIDAPGILINPTKLAPFTHVAVAHAPPPPPLTFDEDGEPLWRQVEAPEMAICFTGNKAVTSGTPILRVTIGDDFIGALSGMRSSEHGLWRTIEHPDSWLAAGVWAKETVGAS